MVFNSMESAAPQLVWVPYRLHTQQGFQSLVGQLDLPMQYELTPPVAFDAQLIECMGVPPYLNEMHQSPVGLGLQQLA
jgi:hypothetical protein